MSTTKETVTSEAYLVAERKGETRNEYVNGEIIPVSGASVSHNTISSNLVVLLGSLLWEKNFLVHQSDMRVYNFLTQSYCYPDVVVVEGEPELIAGESDNLLNPVLLVEVASESTESYDRGDKSLVYRHIPSLREYLIVSQEEPFVEHLVKMAENKWQLEEIRGMDQTLTLLGGRCEIKLADIYRKVRFKP